ncbi:MAG: protein serine/threonine phosphatase [Bacteroidota bacterium]|nr:protein serine/threonine phosphatase [Bacteroidota bacterium]
MNQGPMLQTTITDHENSLIYAQTIQNGLLPKTRHFNKFFTDHFIYYKPQDKISGDFYWLTVKEEVIYFALADCTGHSVAGAMLSVLGISLLNYVIQKNFENVGDFLTELDKKWIETFNTELIDSQFNNDWLEITLISFNTKTREFQYACAGGEFAVCQSKEIKLYKGNNYPIGGWQIEKSRVFDTFSIKIEEKARLYFFSDGVKHQFDAANSKKFSRKRLLNMLHNYNALPMGHQHELIEFIFNTWKEGIEQTDDVSLIGIEF